MPTVVTESEKCKIEVFEFYGYVYFFLNDLIISVNPYFNTGHRFTIYSSYQ